jgi:hypothetical protein
MHRVAHRAEEAEPLSDVEAAAIAMDVDRISLDVFHDQEIDSVVMADVVKEADVRMVERGDRLRFSRELLAEVDSPGDAVPRTLMATVRFSRVSRAR